jgi:hypothetical protein
MSGLYLFGSVIAPEGVPSLFAKAVATFMLRPCAGSPRLLTNSGLRWVTAISRSVIFLVCLVNGTAALSFCSVSTAGVMAGRIWLPEGIFAAGGLGCAAMGAV